MKSTVTTSTGTKTIRRSRVPRAERRGSRSQQVRTAARLSAQAHR